MNDKSIYEVICENITEDGRLSEDFRLPDKNSDPNRIGFAPGAKDSIQIFHAGRMEAEEEAIRIDAILRKAWCSDAVSEELAQEQCEKDAKEIASLLSDKGTLGSIDFILGRLLDDHDDIQMDRLCQYAYAFAFESNDVELVKLGIALWGLTDVTQSEELVALLLRLALYDEFTLFVLTSFGHSEAENELTFNIAQRTSGWGKIHAVDRLRPETDEIKQWLLCYGCKNNVIDAYLGLACAEKSDLISALRNGNLDRVSFDGISTIMVALLDEGPVVGISAYAHREEALTLYLNIAPSYIKGRKEKKHIVYIRDYLKDCDLASKDQLLHLCEEILHQ